MMSARTKFGAFSQGAFDRPLEKESPADGRWFNPNDCSPFSKRSSLSAKLKNSVVSSIVLLLPLSRPSAVVRFVAAIGVWITIERVLGRWLAPHVSEKGIVALNPSLADPNSARAVLPVAPVRGGRTALFNGAPSPVLSGPTLSMGRVASDANVSLLLAVKASAGRCDALSQRLRSNVSPFPAIALAQPNRLSARTRSRALNSYQSPEAMARYVNELRHEL